MGTINSLEPVVRADDLFDGLRPENEGERDKKLQVENSSLERIIEGFEGLFTLDADALNYNLSYQICNLLVPKKIINSELKEFLVYATGLQDHKNFNSFIGLYANSLIQRVQGDVEINLSAFLVPLDFVGYRNNGKTIRVTGNAGSHTGVEMENGLIVIDGNCHSIGRRMSGGRIIIHGDVDEVGGSMTNGRIDIYGNFNGWSIGPDMYGGEIHIDGEFKYHKAFNAKGNIFHKKKQIMKDGKLIGGDEE